MADWKRIKPIDDRKRVMNPTANGWRWTETVPAIVLTLTLEGCEKNRPFGMVKVKVLRSEVGDFYTTFFADPDAFQTAIDCFKNNELIEFKGDFQSFTDIVMTGRVSDVRRAEDE